MDEHSASLTTADSAATTMLQLINGFWVACAIYGAAKLGLADHLHERPTPVSVLAAATGTHAPSLYRLLRALASIGIFAEDQAGGFTLTPLAATLRTDAPGSLRALAISGLGGDHYAAWGSLLHSVQTGETAFNHVYGMQAWEFYAQHPAHAQIFQAAMADLTAVANAAILASYDFSGYGTIVDIGGGHGGFLAAILARYPAARGILFELPEVIARAQPAIEAAGLADRVTFSAGDFFAGVPAGGDLYLFKNIIHDWNDEQAISILAQCRSAMAEGSTILIIETVIPPGNTPHPSKFLDLNMLVMTGGRERTMEEHAALLAAAGLRFSRMIPTPSLMSVIEGRR